MATKKMYNTMCSQQENTKNSRIGRYFGYTCTECGCVTMTVFKANGTTPFSMPCPKCGEVAFHNICTPSLPDAGRFTPPVRSWVRPSYPQMRRLDKSVQHHILMGGLVLESEVCHG